MIATLLTVFALAQDAPAPRGVPRAQGDFAVASLSLEGASLAEACAALSAASGAPVRARGEGLPVTLELEQAGFWEAVLAVGAAAEVGLAPVGTDGEAVLLGAAWSLPDAAADGPVLVIARAMGVKGERSGVLDLELRLAPGLRSVGTSLPRLVKGRDAES